MPLMETLTRKIGPLPVYGYGLILVPLGAWWIHKRQVANTASTAGNTSASNLGSAANLASLTQLAYPMPYSSDVFVNVSNPPANVNVPVSVTTTGNTAPKPVVISNPVSLPSSSPPARKASSTYVVQKGDTLWGIAQKLLGSGNQYPALYAANRSTIEAWARKYGYSSSDGGHWIFPGESLVIPK